LLLRVARPQFLIASLAIFIIGAFWAILLGAPLSLSRLVLGYLIIVPAQLSVSYSNETFDVKVDQHSVPSLFSGGSGVLVRHAELRQPAKWVAIGLIGCSMALGVLFTVIYTYPIWFLGYVAVSNLVGWFYTAPPLRLVYRGLGELSNAITGGLLIPVMGYVVARGTLNSEGLVFTLPLMLYGLAFILSAEIPDMEADRLGHKHTWVARRGRSFSFTAVGVLMLAATGFFFGFPYLPSRALPLDFHILGLLSLLPLGVGVYGMVIKPLKKQAATRLANAIIISLAVFLILMGGTMIFAAARVLNLAIINSL